MRLEREAREGACGIGNGPVHFGTASGWNDVFVNGDAIRFADRTAMEIDKRNLAEIGRGRRGAPDSGVKSKPVAERYADTLKVAAGDDAGAVPLLPDAEVAAKLGRNCCRSLCSDE